MKFFCSTLLLVVFVTMAPEAAAVREVKDISEHHDFAGVCEDGAAARKKRNQCCHQYHGNMGKACEAYECEGGCFMIDKSIRDPTSGVKMCKPICEAKRLVDVEEATEMDNAAQQELDQAEADLEDAKTSNNAEKIAEAQATKETAALRKEKIGEVVTKVSSLDKSAVEAEVAQQLKEDIEHVKDTVISTCKSKPMGSRLSCCSEHCRKEMDAAFPGEDRSVRPKECMTPCNNYKA